MTIPDLGHCAATGTPPVEESVRDEGGERASTGLCPACSGRVELDPNGMLSVHHAAEVNQREDWPER
jgi:hypothetical protein